MKINILLTGGTGFLGSFLVKKIISKSDSYNLIILKRTTSNMKRLNKIKKQIQVYNLDEIELSTVFKENKIDIIIHTAVEYGKNSSDCIKILNTNLMFPISLLEEAIKYNVKMFINTDSYFNKDNFSYNSLLHYALSKKSLKIWLKYFSKNIKVVNLVLEHIYGAYDNDDKFVEYIIQQVAVKKVDTLNLTGGEQKRDFIHVSDVVSAYLAILKHINQEFHFREYYVGNGKSFSIKEFTSYVKEFSNSNTKLNFGALEYRSDEIMNSVADNSELLNLGWSPKFDLEHGIKEILCEYGIYNV